MNFVLILFFISASLSEQIPSKKVLPNSIPTSNKNTTLLKNATAVTNKTVDIKVNEIQVNPINIKVLKKVCPEKIDRIPFFSLPCESTKECGILGPNLVCCKKRCIQGVDPPKPELKHEPILFGLVDRICPEEPLIEFLEVKECDTDKDCSPTRICCKEKHGRNVAGKRYCRNAAANFDRAPVAKQIFQPVQTLSSFLQCAPPPPPVLDLFPKVCSNQFDCFPNLCCQEGNKKVCRPPKRSFLTLIAGVTRRFVSSDWARKFIERITS